MERFAYWIKERESIRKKKERGEKRPWTKDPILRRYRFCCVRREDDRVTKWIAANWRDRHIDVWHAMIVARFINWPPTLEYCGYPEPWNRNAQRFCDRIHALEKGKKRIFTGAYIVSTNGATGSKVDHVIKLFNRAYTELMPFKVKTCQETYDKLKSVNGIGSFMAAQVIADLKYTAVLENAKDWMDFVAPGPGSQRGLNRILGQPRHIKWNNKNFLTELLNLRENAADLLPLIKELHLQDLQNCLCEFDKYERVLNNQGRPRSQYHPSTEPMPGV